MYDNILVPLDGSARAEKILDHVIEMATRFEVEVILLQVLAQEMPLVSPYDSMIDVTPELEREEEKVAARAYLDDVCERLEAANIKTRCRVEVGPVVDTIINVAKEMDVDMVAMASHGRSGLARVFYGSVAAGVLQEIDRPLFLIRAQ